MICSRSSERSLALCSACLIIRSHVPRLTRHCGVDPSAEHPPYGVSKPATAWQALSAREEKEGHNRQAIRNPRGSAVLCVWFGFEP
ncbi:hypothetical protein CCHR01_01420 [Colletotrichum chrysophilum]|uniref:Uncharacterized protein n=1 Tax=Colletotrichum chrysophilum TaxID=1836956 RepID=A0AAD9EP72_9PEZI|nr:hypothetical protein CCHR01_01420 [Colletotrichum chrysophilum]